MIDSDSKRGVMLEEDDLPQKQRRRAVTAREVYVFVQNSFFSEEKRHLVTVDECLVCSDNIFVTH